MQVPRYTSYPTAPHFHDGVNQAEYRSWLSEIKPKIPISLYFHIPFCRALCWFCGCHTKVVNHSRPVRNYLELLLKEMDLLAPYVKKTKLSNIHFGGGSPSIVTPDDFSMVMQHIHHCFSLDRNVEVAIEIDPRSINSEKIKAYRSHGVNRVSIGAQDFSESVQHAINRLQPFELVENTVYMLRDQGINAINIDLIYGLPKQTLGTIEDSINKTLELRPERIALFGYAHVPWLRKHQQLIDEGSLPQDKMRIEMRDYAGQLLQQAGYTPIGIDHFAKPDDPLSVALRQKKLKRNFQGYTTDDSKYLLGLGASSISSLPEGYAQNNGDVIAYRKAILKGDLPIVRGIALNDQDKKRRDIIMALMCALPVQVSPNLFEAELESLTPYFKAGSANYNGEVLSVSPQAHHELRLIASCFDQYLPGSNNLHARAV